MDFYSIPVAAEESHNYPFIPKQSSVRPAWKLGLAHGLRAQLDNLCWLIHMNSLFSYIAALVWKGC